MPIYGYRCQSCKHTFEVMQPASDEPIKNCPECNGQVSKIFYPVGIAFKGSGFHVNDYKSPKRVARESSNGDNGNGSGAEKCGTGGGGDDAGCSSCTTATVPTDS